MVRFSLFITVVVAAASLLATAAGAATHPRLIGVVGKDDAYRISLTSGGALVKSLAAGTYTLVIHDDSAIHNYVLAGPHGQSRTFTSVPFAGTKTITLKLTAGTYKAFCAPHEPIMFQQFTVR